MNVYYNDELCNRFLHSLSAYAPLFTGIISDPLRFASDCQSGIRTAFAIHDGWKEGYAEGWMSITKRNIFKQGKRVPIEHFITNLASSLHGRALAYLHALPTVSCETPIISTNKCSGSNVQSHAEDVGLVTIDPQVISNSNECGATSSHLEKDAVSNPCVVQSTSAGSIEELDDSYDFDEDDTPLAQRMSVPQTVLQELRSSSDKCTTVQTSTILEKFKKPKMKGKYFTPPKNFVPCSNVANIQFLKNGGRLKLDGIWYQVNQTCIIDNFLTAMTFAYMTCTKFRDILDQLSSQSSDAKNLQVVSQGLSQAQDNMAAHTSRLRFILSCSKFNKYWTTVKHRVEGNFDTDEQDLVCPVFGDVCQTKRQSVCAVATCPLKEKLLFEYIIPVNAQCLQMCLDDELYDTPSFCKEPLQSCGDTLYNSEERSCTRNCNGLRFFSRRQHMFECGAPVLIFRKEPGIQSLNVPSLLQVLHNGVPLKYKCFAVTYFKPSTDARTSGHYIIQIIINGESYYYSDTMKPTLYLRRWVNDDRGHIKNLMIYIIDE